MNNKLLTTSPFQSSLAALVKSQLNAGFAVETVESGIFTASATGVDGCDVTLSSANNSSLISNKQLRRCSVIAKHYGARASKHLLAHNELARVFIGAQVDKRGAVKREAAVPPLLVEGLFAKLRDLEPETEHLRAYAVQIFGSSSPLHPGFVKGAGFAPDVLVELVGARTPDGLKARHLLWLHLPEVSLLFGQPVSVAACA